LEEKEIKDVSKQVQEPLNKKPPSDVALKGRFNANSSGVVKDTKTGLEWVAGPDKDTTWNEAKEWVDNSRIDGGRWRMPTSEELETLFEPEVGTCNMTPLLKMSGRTVWSGQTKSSSSAWIFRFYIGCKDWDSFSTSLNFRAFAVRS